MNKEAITTHSLARLLLEGKDIPVVVYERRTGHLYNAIAVQTISAYKRFESYFQSLVSFGDAHEVACITLERDASDI